MPAASPASQTSQPTAQAGPRFVALRLAALSLAPVALAAGIAGGLWRLGWTVPAGETLALLHGPLMVCGLFGMLIGLERAVALGKGWAYAAPILAASATATAVTGLPTVFAATFYLAASLVLAFGSAVIVRLQPALFTFAMLCGAIGWAAGNALWLAGTDIPGLVGWWLAFLLLTIAGERLDLSRLMPRRRGREALFAVSVLLIGAGAVAGIADPAGARIFGLGLIVCALWLLRHDIARRNVRLAGAPRFFAVCMLAGYAWLAVAGALLLSGAANDAAFGYDMALHAVFIGFVFSMVFGHALIILPAITGWRLIYRPLLYAPLAMLHLSLLMRIGGGWLGSEMLRRESGMVTAIAILTFAASLFACRQKKK